MLRGRLQDCNRELCERHDPSRVVIGRELLGARGIDRNDVDSHRPHHVASEREAPASRSARCARRFLERRRRGRDAPRSPGQKRAAGRVEVHVRAIARTRSSMSNEYIKMIARAEIVRSDVAPIAAAAIIGEAVVAITLAQAMVVKFGGDSLREMKDNFERYQQYVRQY